MKNSILYALYEYDTSLFINTFCENKSKPWLHCDGKCQLRKLQKEQRENETEKQLKQLQAEAFLCIHPTCIDFSGQGTANEAISYPVFSHPLYSCLFSDPREKPPQSL